MLFGDALTGTLSRDHPGFMQAVTIRAAKARLNALVEAVERGEQVVLMRGSKHVALIVPLSERDLEVSSNLSDAQAERLWGRVDEERRNGASVVLESPAKAVAFLTRARRPPARRRPAEGRTRRRGR